MARIIFALALSLFAFGTFAAFQESPQESITAGPCVHLHNRYQCVDYLTGNASGMKQTNAVKVGTITKIVAHASGT